VKIKKAKKVVIASVAESIAAYGGDSSWQPGLIDRKKESNGVSFFLW